MTSYLPIVTLMTLCTYCAYASPLLCNIFCAHKMEFPGFKFHHNCNCGENEGNDRVWLRDILERTASRKSRNTTSLSGTTQAPTSTTDICDYLCSIQLGGDACQCSSPGLPGRKRK